MRKNLSLVSWLLIIIFWCVMAYGNVVTRLVMPKPDEVVVSMFDLITCRKVTIWNDTCLWTNLFDTLLNVVVSFALGAPIGLLLGLAIGSFNKAEKLLSSPINFLRAIPVTALASIFLMIFGIHLMRLAMAVFGTALVMTIGVWEGIKNAPKDVVEAAQLDGADKLDMIRYVTWYLALPYTYANVKVSVSLCLVLVIVGEMFIGGNSGVGRLIWDAQYSYNIPTAWAGIIVLGITGVAINKILDVLRPKIIFWE